MSVLGCELSPRVRGGCVSIGNFDGVHLGHQCLLRSLRALASSENTHTVAITFHPHPLAVLQPELAPPPLTTTANRTELLKRFGADHVIVLPVTSSLLSLTPEEFFRQFLKTELNACGIVEGPNFRFGRSRQGDVNELVRLCEQSGTRFRIADLVAAENDEISSSRIRRLISHGSVSQAVTLLGHPYRMTGLVQQGAGRGAGLGFPTANLTGTATLLPAHGVYAGVTQVGSSSFTTAVSIGPNPTFGEQHEKVECFLDGFSGSLYGHTLSTDLISEIRPLRKFQKTADLIEQIHQDIRICRQRVQDHQAVNLP